MGHLAVTIVDNQQLILLKPTVLMNINGRSIARTGIMAILTHIGGKATFNEYYVMLVMNKFITGLYKL